MLCASSDCRRLSLAWPRDCATVADTGHAAPRDRLSRARGHECDFRDEALFGGFTHPTQLFVDEAQLLVDRVQLPRIANPLAVGLSGLLAERTALGEDHGRPGSKLGLLDLQRFRGRAPILRSEGRKLDRRPDDALSGLFCVETRTLRQQADRLGRKRALLRTDIGSCKPDEHLSALDPVALPDEDMRDDAAFTMLNRLALAGNGEPARSHCSRVEPGKGRPSEEENEEQCRNDNPSADFTSRIVGQPIGRAGQRAGVQRIG